MCGGRRNEGGAKNRKLDELHARIEIHQQLCHIYLRLNLRSSTQRAMLTLERPTRPIQLGLGIKTGRQFAFF